MNIVTLIANIVTSVKITRQDTHKPAKTSPKTRKTGPQTDVYGQRVKNQEKPKTAPSGRTYPSRCYPAVIAGYSESTPPGCFGQSSWPGWCSFGCCLIVFCWWLRSRVSWSVLALWHSCESHCRLSRLWLSPGLMWSHSVPIPVHPLAWCWAWHLLCALACTWRRMAAHWVGGGRRCLRLLVFHLLRGCMWMSPALLAVWYSVHELHMRLAACRAVALRLS